MNKAKISLSKNIFFFISIPPIAYISINVWNEFRNTAFENKRDYFDLLGVTTSTIVLTVPVTTWTPVETTSDVIETAESAIEYIAQDCKDKIVVKKTILSNLCKWML